MIVKQNFNPVKVLGYIWRELLLGFAASLVVYVLYSVLGFSQTTLPTLFVVLMGLPLAIFVSFRSDLSYSRWEQAAEAWYHIVGSSRIFARLVITFIESHMTSSSYDPQLAKVYQHQMIYRHLAWVNALRLQLRGESDDGILKRFLSDQEFRELKSSSEIPMTNFLMKLQGTQIYQAMSSGILQGFDSFQLESHLGEFETLEATCDRIKNIQIPRQYDYFARVFIYLFIILVPLGFISSLAGIAWVIIPITLIISAVFGVLERMGLANESPFENRVTDVPLSALCVQIERELRGELRESDLPPIAVPVDGYLW